MNKSELVTLLRDPGHLSSQQLEELETIVEANPYFLSARLLLAKGSKEAKHPQTKRRIASAAVYSTDRILFKKYLSGDLFFLSQPKTEVQAPRKKVVTASQGEPEAVKKEAPREDKRPSALKPVEKKPVPEVPNVPAGDLDAILEELKQDMQNLKSSRAHFVEVQQQIVDKDELDSIKKAVEQEVELDSEQKPVQESSSESEGAGMKESTKEVSDVEPVVDEKEEAIKAKEAELLKKEEELKAKEEELKKQAKAKEQELKKEAKEKKTTPKRTATKAKAKKTSTEEEDEVVSKKLAELALKKEKDKPAKKESEIAAKKETEKPEKKETAKKAKRTSKKEEKETEASAPTEAKSKIEKSKTEAKKEAEKSAGREESPFHDQEERAEDPFKDSRFDRDATRSYLRKLEPPEEFPFFDDDTDSSDDGSEAASRKDLKEEEPKEEKPKPSTKRRAKADPAASESEVKPKRSTKKEATPKEEATSKKEPGSKKEAVPEKEPATKKEATSEKEATTKKEIKPKEVKPSEPAAAPKSGESTAPKGSIMKKAKLVKSKRSSRKSGSSGTSKVAGGDKGNEDDGKSDRDQQKEIIDKFIKDSPSIKYTRETEGKSDDLAVDSGTWDKNLTSEYLAEIYLKQGNKKRAIEIYEALSLKYPEKKSYFADLISKSK